MYIYIYIYGCKRHGFPEKDILYRSIEHPSFYWQHPSFSCWEIHPRTSGVSNGQCHWHHPPGKSPFIYIYIYIYIYYIGGINLPFPGIWVFYDVFFGIVSPTLMVVLTRLTHPQISGQSIKHDDSAIGSSICLKITVVRRCSV